MTIKNNDGSFLLDGLEKDIEKILSEKFDKGMSNFQKEAEKRKLYISKIQMTIDTLKLQNAGGLLDDTIKMLEKMLSDMSIDTTVTTNLSLDTKGIQKQGEKLGEQAANTFHDSAEKSFDKQSKKRSTRKSNDPARYLTTRKKGEKTIFYEQEEVERRLSDAYAGSKETDTKASKERFVGYYSALKARNFKKSETISSKHLTEMEETYKTFIAVSEELAKLSNDVIEGIKEQKAIIAQQSQDIKEEVKKTTQVIEEQKKQTEALHKEEEKSKPKKQESTATPVKQDKNPVSLDNKSKENELDLYHMTEKRNVTYDEIIDKIKQIISLEEKVKTLDGQHTDDGKYYWSLYDEYADWSEEEKTIAAISERLKEIYSKYNGKISLISEDDIKEATYLVDMLTGAGVDPKLNKAQTSFFENKKFKNKDLFKFVELDESIDGDIESATKEIQKLTEWLMNFEGINISDNLKHQMQSLINEFQLGEKSVEEYTEALLKIFDIQAKVSTPDQSSVLSGDVAPAIEAQNKLESTVEETTSALEEQEKVVKRILYHWGNFNSGKVGESFNQMITSYFAGVNDPKAKSPYGAFGTGVYSISNPERFTSIDTSTEDPLRKFMAIDVSNLKMYETKSEEHATALFNFLTKLQQMCINLATGFDYDGKFDASTVSVDGMYKEAKSLFANMDMTYEEYIEFINHMQELVKKSELGTGKAVRPNGEGKDNIATKFMKALGYQGIDNTGTSYDSFTHGSVIFDKPDLSMVTKWDTASEAIEHYNQNVTTAIRLTEEVNQTPLLTPVDSGAQEQTEQLDKIETKLQEVRVEADKTADAVAQVTQPPVATPTPAPESKVGEEAKEEAQEVEVASEQMEDSNEEVGQSEKELEQATVESRQKSSSAVKEHADNVEKETKRIIDAIEREKRAYSDESFKGRDIVSQTGLKETYFEIGEDGEEHEKGMFSFVERLQDGQLQSVLVEYNEETQKWEENVVSLSTAFEKVGNEIISMDNKIKQYEIDRDKTKAAHPTYDTSADDKLIGLAEERRQVLLDTLQIYHEEEEYAYKMLIFEEKRLKNTERLNALEQKSSNLLQAKVDENNAKEAKKNAEEIVKVNGYIDTALNILKKSNAKYGKNVNKPLDAESASDLEQERRRIEGIINGYRGNKSLSPVDTAAIKGALTDFDIYAKEIQDKVYAQIQLNAKNVDENLEKVRTKLKILISDMEKSGNTSTQIYKDAQNLLTNLEKPNIDAKGVVDISSKTNILSQKLKATNDQYKKNYETVQNYSKAQDKLNELLERQVKNGTSNALTADIEAQKNEVEKLEQKAIDAGLAIENMFKAGSISQEQKDDALNKLLTGSDRSSAVLAGARKDQNNKSRYNENLKIIKDYVSAKKELDVLNSQLVKQGNNPGLTKQIEEQTKKVINLEKKANDAETAILKMFNAGEITSEDGEKAIKLKDGASSSGSLSNALNAEMLKHQSEINNIRDKYEQLGVETSEVNTKLQALENAYAEVTSSATKDVNIRIQKELEYKKVLESTKKALVVDSKNSKQDIQFYKDNLKVIDDYSKKRDRLNKLLKDQVKSGESNELSNEIKLVSKELEGLAIDAKEALDYIQLLFDTGAIDSDLKDKAYNIFDKGSDISSGKLLGALDDKREKHSEEIVNIEKEYLRLGLTADEVTNKMLKLKNASDDVKKASSASVTDRIEKEKNYQLTLEETKKDLEQVADKYKGLNGKRIGTFADPEAAKKGALEYAQTLGKVTKELQYSDDPVNGIYTMTTEVRNASGEVKKLVFNWKNSMTDMTVSTKMLRTELTGLPGIFQEIGRKVHQLGVYWAANFLNPMDLLRYGRTIFNHAKQYDDALTEMMKVSEESIGVLQDFQKESFKIADGIGATASAIQNSTADFMRLGYDLGDASELSEWANIYANVGDMGIEEATEHMVSSVKAWSSEFANETEAAEAIVNRYNEVGNNFAITSADIGAAMETSAAALKAGGNDLNESLGLLVAGNLIQQDASTTAAALKILSLRIRGAKADLEEMGESTDGLADSTSKMREEIKGLTGVDIMLDEDTFKSTAEIIKEIGAVWDNLTDVSKAATLEKLAGEIICLKFMETYIYRTHLIARIA